MAYGYHGSITWKGDPEKGAEMERIVNRAFESNGKDKSDPRIEKIRSAVSEKLNVYDGSIGNDLDSYNPFTGDDSHTLTFFSNISADIRGAFNIVFETFPELEFFQELDSTSNDYGDSLFCEYRIFAGGEESDGEWAEFEDDVDGNAALNEEMERIDKVRAKWLKGGAADDGADDNPDEDNEDSDGDSGDAEITAEEEALAAVKQNGEALYRVPDKLKTPEVCREAVKQNGRALAYVPENLRTREICETADKTGGGIRAFHFIPAEFRTKEIIQRVREECLKTLENLDMAIDDVPEGMLDPELCRAAARGGLDLSNIPRKYRTAEVCLEAIKRHGSECEEVPKAIQSEAFFLEAVKVNANGKALKYVPKEYRTLEVCITALRLHPDLAEELLDCMPEALQAEVKKAAGITD